MEHKNMRWTLVWMILLCGSVWARDWYLPAGEGKAYVNPHLTVVRALRAPKADWDGQLVLWSGRLRHVKRLGAGWSMQLETPDGIVPVRCPRAVLTLKPDPREGCKVAVKGEVHLERGRLCELVGRSIILLEPAQWKAAHGQKEFLCQWIGFHCPDEKAAYADQISRAILQQAQRNGLDPWLFAALLQIESAYRKDALSSSGAIGLGQLMPFTAEGLAVDPWDPEQNVAGSAKMLAGLLQGWKSGLDPRVMALASYNAGPGLVRQLQGVPSIPETNNYVYFIGYLQHHLNKLNNP